MAAQTIDLHGKTWAEALTEFRDFYNTTVRSGGGGSSLKSVTLEAVHGYGSTGQGGRLRTSLRTYLERQNQAGILTFRTGEAVDGNPGHTFVTPLKPLPQAGEDLAESIWEHCARPQTERKIMNRFRRHGDPQVRQAIRELEFQRRLRSVIVGRERGYEAN